MSLTCPILLESVECLSFHNAGLVGEDEIPLGTFFRLVFKSLAGRNPTAEEWEKIKSHWVENVDVDSTKIQVSASQIIEDFCITINPERHIGREPAKRFGAIVAIEVHGNKRIIDGTTRIVYWNSIDPEQVMEINVHALSGLRLEDVC